VVLGDVHEGGAERVLVGRLAADGELDARLAAHGGLIVMRRGQWALARNTATMSWALHTSESADAGI
jgi:hypothetical protein